jgi:tetratricopeptide (TPR) repeat protein
MKFDKLALLLLLAFVLAVPFSVAQVTAVEKDTQILTYPFNDPDPLPLVFKRPELYPYNRFDGFSDKATKQTWKMVVLENELIRIEMLPEVGGKIFSAWDKTRNREFLYSNPVLKFRDIALRGPWTSGGIEFNFGFIGHTPATAHPVNHVIKEYADGSKSCLISAMDISARTIWQIEVKLEPGKTYFSTTASWQNLTPFHQSYYHWYNTAIQVRDDLKYVFPGNHYIGHDGDLHPYPVDEKGRDLSYYKNHEFDSHKSLHVLGSLKPFYGAILENDSFGMAHYSFHNANPGKKIWTWSLGRDGAIWEDLLSDGRGQYSEVQSGRLFNQATLQSGLGSPFTQTSLGPGVHDEWTDLWMPVAGLQNISDLDTSGALEVKIANNQIEVAINAFSKSNQILVVKADGKTLAEKMVSLEAADAFRGSFQLQAPAKSVSVTWGTLGFFHPEKDLFPVPAPLETDSSNASHWVHVALENANFRKPTESLAAFNRALDIDPHLEEALLGSAEILLSVGNETAALERLTMLTRRSIYHPGANFQLGILHRRQGAADLAKHHFMLASRSMGYRAVSLLQLTELAVSMKNWDEALEFAKQSQALQPNDWLVTALLATVHRLSGRDTEFRDILNEARERQPLNPFLQAEAFLMYGGNPWVLGEEYRLEVFKEIGIRYSAMGLEKDSRSILHLAEADHGVSRVIGSTASQSSSAYLPFRLEEKRWLEKRDDWKSIYGLALIEYRMGNEEKALEMLKSLKSKPREAFFYLVRGYAQLATSPKDGIIDLRKSLSMQENWRIYKYLSDACLKMNQLDSALHIATRGFAKHPNVAALGIQQATLHGIAGNYAAGLSVLDTLLVLPYEGAGEGRYVYEWLLAGAVKQALDAGDLNLAKNKLSRFNIWRERLGSGRPLNYFSVLYHFLAIRLAKASGDEAMRAKLQGELDKHLLSNPNDYEKYLFLKNNADIPLDLTLENRMAHFLSK